MSYQEDANDMEDLLRTFTSEGQELLDEVEPRLIELQERSDMDGGVNEEVLNSIFRIFHTIKGSAGFLELNSLQEVTHEAETLLDHYRKGLLNPSVEQIGLLLHTTDFIRKLLNNIEKYLHDRGFEPEAKKLKQELAQAAGKGGQSKPEPVKPAAPIAPPVPAEPVSAPAAIVSSPVEMSGESEDLFVFTITSEMLEQYTRESLDLLDSLEQVVLEIEKDPENSDLIDRAFRALHTLKGNSGLLGYGDMEKLSHKTESLFSHLRNGTIHADMEITKMVLSILDYLHSTVIEITQGGAGKIRGCDVLIGFIEDVIIESVGDLEEESAKVQEPVPAEPSATVVEIQIESPAPVVEMKESQKEIPVQTEETPREEKTVRPADANKEQAVSRKDIRVDLDKVDKLVDLVGELALAEMMVVQNPALLGLEAEEFDRAVHHLDRVISELQYVSMSLRMMPIASTFRKLIRLVHDLSYKSNKSVKLITVGEDTEVDKTVVDLIADPLVHMVRNSVDHGIEPPEDRKIAGKNETGTVTIEAKHEGGEVWIEISDDGRGLSREKILKKAHQMGLVSGDGAELKDEEVYKLILEPGFSTADKITEVSGRGVGMDVVKRNLEKINGHVDIATVPGKGSKFTLRIPLTLALMDGMLVQVGQTRYIVPLLSIRECIRPRHEDITVTMDGQEIVRVREDLIPVVRLHLLHNIQPEYSALEDALLLMVEHRGTCFCVMVDAVLGQQQAVIKGLSDYVGNVRGVSGCTILGDGTVSLILDIGSLWEMAGSMAGVA